MKQLFSSIILFAAALSISSLSVNAQTGNVGVGTNSPGSKLTVNGSLAASYRSETSTSGAIGANDYYVVWNGAANGTLTLPAAVTGAGNFKGRLYFIKNTTTTTNLTLAANGTEQIDGAASISLPPGYAVNLVNTGATSGTTWEVIAFVSTTLPQFRTSSVVSNTGTISLTGQDPVAKLIPGLTLTVNNPTGQSLNYLINSNIAMDGGLATPLNAGANMFAHIIAIIYVDGVATSFASYMECEPTRIGQEGNSNLIGGVNGNATLTPGNHTIEVRYVVSAVANVSGPLDFNQAGSTLNASTIY
jgi:hypothetical protein